MNRLDQREVPSGFSGMKWFAYATIGVVACAVASTPQNNFGWLWTRPAAGAGTLLFVARLLVFAELLAMAYRWITATHYESETWVIWLRTHPRENQKVYGAMFGLAALLGLELALVPHARLLIFIAATLAFFNFWTQSVANEHFAGALKQSRLVEDDPILREGLDVLESYWLGKPQLGRIAIQIYFIGLAFTLAAIAALVPEPKKTWYQAAAYGLLFLTLLVTEAMITNWRNDRDEQLKVLEAKQALQKPELA